MRNESEPPTPPEAEPADDSTELTKTAGATRWRPTAPSDPTTGAVATPPDDPRGRSWWQWTLLVTGSVLTCATGALALVVGLHDVALALRSEEQAIGAAFATSGAASFVAVILFWRGRRIGLAWTLTAVGCLFGLILLLVQTSFRSDTRNWYWAGLAAAPVVGGILMQIAQVKQDQDSASNQPSTDHRYEVLTALLAAGATIASALLGLAGGAFRPVANPSTLDVDVTVKVVDERREANGTPISLVETSVTLENISRERLVIAGSFWTLTGYNVPARETQRQEDWLIGEELRKQGWSGRYETPSEGRAVEVGTDLFTPGDYIEPGQTVTTNFLTPVPSQRFDAVGSTVAVATGYHDRLRLGEQLASTRDDILSLDAGVTSEWVIDATSWTAHLTRNPQLTAVTYALTSHENPKFPSDLDAPPRLVDGIEGTFEIGQEQDIGFSYQINRTEEYAQRVETFYGNGWTAGYATALLVPD